MSIGYFHACLARCGTGLWVNNPTPAEAAWAVARGALGCTTNPTFAARMLEQRPEVQATARRARDEHGDGAAAVVQRACLAPICPIFAPQWTGVGGLRGWVSIQGDPFREDDAQAILDEARAVDAIAPNAIAKIPVTAAGLAAIDILVRENRPVLATEIFALAQARAVCETWQRASRASGHAPALFVTHITGIYDEHLRRSPAASNLDPWLLGQAGILLARRQRRMLRQHGWPGQQMGGGVRGRQHWTAMVGGDLVVTLNPSTIDELEREPAPVAAIFEQDEDPGAMRALRAALPDFDVAWELDGLAVADFADYGPVRLFRSMFEAGWHKLQTAVGRAP
jgi:transaldolase